MAGGQTFLQQDPKLVEEPEIITSLGSASWPAKTDACSNVREGDCGVAWSGCGSPEPGAVDSSTRCS